MVWNLHALRGVICLGVVWLHLLPVATAFGLTNPVLHSVRWFGFGAVDTFFVLSGFIMAYTTDKHNPAEEDHLLSRRWKRLR